MVYLKNLPGVLLLINLLCVASYGQESQTEDEDGEMGGSSKKGHPKFSVVPPGYDKLKIPLSKSKNKNDIRVSVSMMIHEVLDIDEQNGILLLDTDFSMRWLDGNIYDHYQKHGWKDPKTGRKIPNATKLEDDVLEELWTPDIFIDEMEKVKRSNILSKPIMLNFIGPTNLIDQGEILYSARIQFKLMCGMSFEYYPADTQTCAFHLRSYSYTVDELYLRWRFATSVGVFLDEDDNPNFDIQVASVEPLLKSKALHIEENFDVYRRGNYSALKFVIKIRRKLSYHLVQTYLPSVLLIFITWLCFFLPTNMVEARIGISMTTVLTLTAMFAAVREKCPDVSYTMSIDVWMVFCIINVFLTLLCFSLSYWMKKKLDHKCLKKPDDEYEEEDEAAFPNYETYTFFMNMTKKYAFRGFSATFLVFMAIYWGLLLHWSKYLDWNVNLRFNGIKDDTDDTSNLYRYLTLDIPGQEDGTNPTFLELIRNKTPELINFYRAKM